MSDPISTDPLDRLGIYKHIDEVPPDRRLESYHSMYDGRDTYGEFLVQKQFKECHSYSAKQTSRRAGQRWKEHIANTSRHHALATPADVERWCSSLLEDLTCETAYKEYWAKLESFYDWLLWRTDHPHCYNPVLMAAAHGDTANAIWQEKIGEFDR